MDVDGVLIKTEQLYSHAHAADFATDQEKYRAANLRDVVFPGKVDGMFVSCGLGYQKTQPEFFKTVLASLGHDLSGLKPSEVMFFDDSEPKVVSAASEGLRVEVYTSNQQVQRLLE